MAEVKVDKDILTNLDLLIDFDLLKNEKDWALLRDLGGIPHVPKKSQTKESDTDYDK